MILKIIKIFLMIAGSIAIILCIIGKILSNEIYWHDYEEDYNNHNSDSDL